MALRPEFELLESHYQQLYYNIDVDQEFLRRVKDNVRLCEYIAKTNIEKNIITRTVYWWRKRATKFGLDINQSDYVRALIGPAKTPAEINADDRRFLRSLRISWDEGKEEGIE